ncbi:MAG: hypothetical protein K8T89_18140 [Planctomycetes bacterium]|nr:hypothetical protein [Planctomycetota bacterium]
MILLIFILLAFALTLFLWSGSMVLQGWLYQNPAEKMPIRALASGSALAFFLSLWCFLDARTGGKYDTVFEFSPVDISDHDSFDTVMKNSSGGETIVHYEKRTGTKGTTGDFFDAKGQPWKKNTADSMAVAILIKDKDKPEPARFKANLDPKGNFVGELRYTDANGRYMSADNLGRVFRKKVGVLFANILLNTLHFLLWWAVLWYGVRFAFWHAFGLAAVMWIFTMLAVQPVLFNVTRPKDDGKAAERVVFIARRASKGESLPLASAAGYEENAYTEARMCMISPSLTT